MELSRPKGAGRSAALILLGAVLSVSAARGQLEDLDQVLVGHYKALGGLERLQSIRTVQFLGVMTIGVEANAPFVMTFKRPLKSRLEFTVEGMTGIQAYDGETAWVSMPMMGQAAPAEMPAAQAENMAEQADFDGPLVDWQSKGHSLKLVGVEEIESGPAYKIEIALANGNTRIYFLDTTTLLTVQQEGKATIGEVDVDLVTKLSDYKKVGGVQFPHLIESAAQGAPAGQRFAIDHILVNEKVEDDLFSMSPETAPPAG